MTLYEINQQAYAKLPTKSAKEFRKLVADFIFDCDNRYYMLLNHDQRYFTVFCHSDNASYNDVADEVLDIVKDLGIIKSVEKNKDTGMVEFWLLLPGKKVSDMYAFFPYDRGVIEV